MIAEQANAQSIPKPSAPEFTLNLTEHPYDVLPLTTTDPYTGNNITARVGYQVQNMSVELIITNQPFTPYQNSNDNTISLYYNVSWKGHYENGWHTSLPHYPASNSSYTVLAFGINIPEYANFPAIKLGNFPIESQLDFRIEALIGYYAKVTVHLIADDDLSPFVDRDVFYGETSDWSSIQTVTVGKGSVAVPTPTISTPTPTEPASQNTNYTTTSLSPIQPATQTDTLLGLDWRDMAIILLAVALGVVVLVVVFSRWKHAAAPST